MAQSIKLIRKNTIYNRASESLVEQEATETIENTVTKAAWSQSGLALSFQVKYSQVSSGIGFRDVKVSIVTYGNVKYDRARNVVSGWDKRIRFGKTVRLWDGKPYGQGMQIQGIPYDQTMMVSFIFDTPIGSFESQIVPQKTQGLRGELSINY